MVQARSENQHFSCVVCLMKYIMICLIIFESKPEKNYMDREIFSIKFWLKKKHNKIGMLHIHYVCYYKLNHNLIILKFSHKIHCIQNVFH